ncbi:MAG: organomercurial lyase [Candidatus Odinarchaeota archaeon]
MPQLATQRVDQVIEEFFTLHLVVLKQILTGKSFKSIRKDFRREFTRFNYQEVTSALALMKYDKNGELTAAIPLSPRRTDYRVTVDGAGSGYAMCAADALAVAYLFEERTVIDSVDAGSGKPIRIIIDPQNPGIEGYSDMTITTPKTAIPSKKEGEISDVTVDTCPFIGFVEDFELIPEGQRSLVNKTSFEQVHDMAKLGFDPEFMKSELKAYLAPLIAIFREGSLTDKKLAEIYLENSKNPFTMSVPFEDLRRSVANQFIARGVIRWVPRTKTLELTLQGKRIVLAFYN